MASRIGSDLHRARTRREIELSEVEAATRIRARFLRAIEREEWDLLPGDVYARGFVRTYANFLGLDGDRLAEDYRRDVEAPGSPEPSPVVAVSRRRPGDLKNVPWLAVAALGAVVLLAAIAIFALPGGGGGGGEGASRSGARSAADRSREDSGGTATTPAGKGVSIRLSANAEVWVCVLGAGGDRLVDGQILEAGAAAGPFRSDSFTLSLGNGEVTMTIDGAQAEIPATASPIGYSIDSSGALTELSEAERPTCT